MSNGVIIKLNENDFLKIVNNNNFGLFVAQEWKRLISPYTPRREGRLEDTARVKPWEIEYGSFSNDPNTAPYAAYVYYGDKFKFRKDKNVFATSHWDRAAINAKQDDKLIRAAQKYIDKEKL